MSNGKFRTIKFLVLLVIVVVAFFYIYKLVNNKLAEKKYDDITTNMLVIQKKVKMINGETRVNVENEGFVGKKVLENDNPNVKASILKAGVSEEELEDYYILYMNDFETMGIINELKRANSEEYAVNYKQNEVIYVKGIDVDGKKMYKLSDIFSEDEDDAKVEENKSEEE